MSSVLVVATHLDDETLGCGGSLLKHRAQGDDTHCVFVTAPTAALGYSMDRIEAHAEKVQKIASMYDFATVHQFNYASTLIDTIPEAEIVNAFSLVLSKIKPQILYLPFAYDVHGDHQVSFRCAFSAAKNFRAPFVRRILMMETVSETDYAVSIPGRTFVPNFYVDIGDYFDKKIAILSELSEEIGDHPFPRSIEHIRALATHRGVSAGCMQAEGFMLLKEIT